ncbi:MAG: hypothetical protein OXC15_15455 [Rhodospirillaceae bacterium]|nr:hypothetical protein [Rhodospirillaceae bacterium]
MLSRITAVVGAAAVATMLTAGAAQAQDYRFTILTQTGIDNTFWQTIKRGMDDACEDYAVDCQLLFTQENGNLQMHLQNLETTIAQGDPPPLNWSTLRLWKEEDRGWPGNVTSRRRL